MRSYHRLTVAFLFIFATVGTHLIQATPLPFEVKIEQTELLSPGDTAHVRVTLDQAPFDIGAFDFTIAVDASILTLANVTPGSLFFDQGECNWEYFTFSDFPNDTIYQKSDSVFTRSVRVVGFASSISSGPPACYLPDLSSPATLFTLHYTQASANSDCMKSASPVRFLWNTCADNVFSVVDGSQLILSDKVYDVDTAGYIEFSDHYNSPFPTYQGTQYDQCVPTGPVPASDQFIDFYNGMVRYDCHPSSSDTSHIALRIDRIENWGDDDPMEVPVYIENNGTPIGGFDLLIAYDGRTLGVTDVTPGEHYFETCEWEYFTYRTGPQIGGDTLPPSGLVRVVGISEVNDCCHHPLCDITDAGPTPLFTINLEFIQDREHVNCAFSPIQFYWTSCADNAISDPTGNELYIGGRVVDQLPPYQLTNPFDPGGYPTFAGPQDSDCFDPELRTIPQKSITFTNGGIDFICIDLTDITGDVNLNGISYEIADWVLFSNYFTQGLSVFTIDENGQSKATDVTLDSLELSIYDLVYMARIISGDAYPHPEDWINHSHGSAKVSIDPATDILSVETIEYMGGAYFIFAGQITPTLLQSNMDMSYLYDPATNQTKVLIASLEGEYFEYGGLLGNITTDQIMHMEIATSESYIIDLNSPPNADGRMTIRIESHFTVDQTPLIPVSVSMENSDAEIGGFDFLIAYDANILNVNGVTPGDRLIDSCEWEYFTYRTETGSDSLPQIDASLGLLRVVAIAETNNGSHHPNCYLPESMPADLFTIDFLRMPVYEQVNCTFAPVRFYWTSCADNGLANPDGSEFYIADSVIDAYTLINLADPTYPGGYPTYTGPQNSDCYPPDVPNQPEKIVTLINGGIEFNCLEDSIDFIGDVNLNGIGYEIADWVLFSIYFLNGTSAFTVDTNRQILATDVTFDGQQLTINDLVYLGRVIQGDALPMPSNWSDHVHGQAEVTIGPYNDILSVQTTEEMGGAFFIFAGNIIPELLQSDMDLHYQYDPINNQTRVLITSLAGESSVSGDLLGNITTDQILHMEIATAESYIVDLNSPPNDDRMTFRIGNPRQDATAPIEIPIVMEQGNTDLGGFDFLMAYDDDILEVTGVRPGAFYDSCGWEYFTYRTETGSDSLPQVVASQGLIRVVAIANISYPLEAPTCYLPREMPADLFTIDFALTVGPRSVECIFSPIRFYWASCGDNALTDFYGDKLFIADSIFDYFPGNNLTDPYYPGGYPTYTGPQNSDCFDPSSPKSPIKAVTLFNGGIEFICGGDSVDIHGDVNLNLIGYEIADWVLFSNYFLYGTSVFTVDTTRQILATDVTFDGQQLTINDLVYLGRVIQGDAFPHPQDWINHSHGSAKVSIDPATDILSVETIEYMGGAYFIFAGQVTPTLLQSNMDMSYLYDPITNQTKVLIASLEGEYFEYGGLLGNITTDQILHMEIATSESYIIDLHTVPDNDSRMRVRIESRQNVPLVSQQPVAVMMDHSDFEVGGFDFLIAYDASVFSLNSVVMGQFLADSCQWEYFTYRTDVASGCTVEPCPSGLVRIVSIAEINNGEAHPACFTPDPLPAELFTMNFGLSVGPEVAACNFFPFSFYWQDCADNAFATDNGYDIIIADSVVAPDDPYGSIADPNDPGGYPTFAGPQDSDCFTAGQTNAPINRMTLLNGGIDFLCNDTLETIGDINMNGIAFEIADWVLFSNYFIYGKQVFLVNLNNQEVNSDVNMDGQTLQLDDYVQLGMVVFGAGAPSPGPADHVTFNLDDNGVMSVQSNLRENLSAVQIVIKGEIDPVLLADQMDMGYNYDSTNTSILIFSYDMTSSIGKEVIASGFENSVILSIRGASVDGREVIIAVDRDVATDVGNPPKYLPLTYSVGQNFPNPFNPSTTIQFDLPKASTVEFDVINIMGQTVYHAADFYSAGSHSIEWNTETQGRSVASGVYYYRIKAGDFAETRKMILLK